MSKNASEFIGTGRRKTAVARVRIKPGSGKFVINGKDLDDYCPTDNLFKTATAPLRSADQEGKFDIRVLVNGGGMAGQVGAIRLGLARALQTMDEELRPSLKKDGHLKRDPRMKERKKPGQPGARKQFQFSKR